MRIALSTGNLNTAGSKYIIQDMVFHLMSSSEWEVEVIVHLPGGNVYESLQKAGVKIHVIPLRFEHSTKKDLVRRTRANSKALKRLNLDVIHSFDYASSFSEALSARLAGIKFAFTKTNMLWNRNYGIKSTLANAVVALNEDQLNQFFLKTSIQKKTKLIPNGVDIEKFKPLTEVEKHEIPTIGFVAYIVQVKGHPFFAEVVAKVKSKVDFPFQVLCAGAGEEEYVTEVKDKVKELGIEQEFKFSGFITDIPEFYNKCHMAVLPTTERGEACPMAVLEAMACGIPILVSNTPGNHNIVNETVGWVRDFGEVDSWADLLADALRDIKGLSEKGTEARSYVQDGYSLNGFLTKHLKLYQNLVKA